MRLECGAKRALTTRTTGRLERQRGAARCGLEVPLRARDAVVRVGGARFRRIVGSETSRRTRRAGRAVDHEHDVGALAVLGDERVQLIALRLHRRSIVVLGERVGVGDAGHRIEHQHEAKPLVPRARTKEIVGDRS